MAEEDVPPRKAGMSGRVKLLIALVAVLVGCGSLLALYFAGVFGDGESSAVAGKPAVSALAPPLYIPLDPPLVVNFDRNGRMGLLQATVQVMTRNAKGQAAMALHMPVIRNNLLLLLSSKSYDDVSTREGKEALRQEALAEINSVLQQQGETVQIEELYFTGFVMQ